MSVFEKYKYRKMLSARFKDDEVIEIGIDEAGRGSFLGPIMAGAVIIPNESTWTNEQKSLLIQLRDSKKISPKKRERIADQIKELIPKCAVGIVTAKEINDNGITWANMEAFRRAIQNLNLENTSSCRLVIDGVLSIDKWEGEQELIVEGDSQLLAIAGASILAKVEHDRWITKFCEENPECNERYDLMSSKGYGTAKHRNGIKLFGGHDLHRVLYIQNWLPGSTQKVKPRNKNASKCLIKF
jgi:ribonuclease HII